MWNSSPQNVPSLRFHPPGGALYWKYAGQTAVLTDSYSEDGVRPRNTKEFILSSASSSSHQKLRLLVLVKSSCETCAEETHSIWASIFFPLSLTLWDISLISQGIIHGSWWKQSGIIRWRLWVSAIWFVHILVRCIFGEKKTSTPQIIKDKKNRMENNYEVVSALVMSPCSHMHQWIPACNTKYERVIPSVQTRWSRHRHHSLVPVPPVYIPSHAAQRKPGRESNVS